MNTLTKLSTAIKTIGQLATTKAIPFDELIGNSPAKYGRPPERKVYLQDTLEIALKENSFKCYLREVLLNPKGYDRGGSLWGYSPLAEHRLWVVHAGFLTARLLELGYGVKDNPDFKGREGETFYVDFFRGRDREDVARQVKDKFPFAYFCGVNLASKE